MGSCRERETEDAERKRKRKRERGSVQGETGKAQEATRMVTLGTELLRHCLTSKLSNQLRVLLFFFPPVCKCEMHTLFF